MPRNISGTYSLPEPAFVAGTTILSASVNSDFNDVATALTESLATTGVSSMTGPIKAASGSVTAPSYSFSSATGTGFYLSGTNEFSWTANGVLAATFAANAAVTWAGSHTFQVNISVTGNAAVTGTFLSSGITTLGPAAVVVATASMSANLYIDIGGQSSNPVSAPANRLRLYVKADGFNDGQRPFGEDEQGRIWPLTFQGGQCRLTKSGANLLLSPYEGNLLTINGVPKPVPDAGITLAASNTAATFVYIYAFLSSGTMTLEMSTTVPTLQAGTGVKQKTGDATRTLVGAAYTDTGGAWADTNGKLWTLSYFNRKKKTSRLPFTADRSTISTSFTILNAETTTGFITWSDEETYWAITGSASNGDNQSVSTGCGIDASTQDATSASFTNGATHTTNIGLQSIIAAAALTENANHEATLLGRVSAGIGIWAGTSDSGKAQCFLNVAVMG